MSPELLGPDSGVTRGAGPLPSGPRTLCSKDDCYFNVVSHVKEESGRGNDSDHLGKDRGGQGQVRVDARVTALENEPRGRGSRDGDRETCCLLSGN